MEVQWGRGVKDESKVYRLTDKNGDTIARNILAWGMEKWCIWFLICWLDERATTWTHTERVRDEGGGGVEVGGINSGPLESLRCRRHWQCTWRCEKELYLWTATLHTTHTQWKEMPHRLWFWWLNNLDISHLPNPCLKRTTTSYPFLHPHLLPSRLNFFEVNGYNGQGDVGKEWNLSHTSSISIKLHGSWKIKGKGLGAKHILGFIEPHFRFPNPGLGHSIPSARLWNKLFQGWNQ